MPEVANQGGFAIAFSRAGYGLSDRHDGRTVISNTRDTAAILQHFGVTSFVSIGWSGGGPHCLADTTLAQNKAAISIAGVGAFGASDLDFLAGMGEENHVEFGAAIEGWALQNYGFKAVLSSPFLNRRTGRTSPVNCRQSLDPPTAA